MVRLAIQGIISPVAQEVYHPTSPAAFRRLQRIVRLVLAVVAHTTVRGLENVPPTGPALVVVNHLSFFDVPAVFVTSPRHGVTVMTTKWRRNPVTRALAREAGCIWVERGEADRAALKAMLEVLKAGLLLAIAPEGTRSPTHALQRAKPGVAYIATRANAPILPVVVQGVEEIKHTFRRWRRAKVTITYGQVFRLPDDPRAKGEALEAYATEIMCHLAALLPERYRGVYAGHPRVKELVD